MTMPSTLDEVLSSTPDPLWVIDEDGCDLLRESSRETRFAISNGFLGVRGAQAINRVVPWIVPPCTYVAGLFETPDGERAIPGLIPGPDWLGVRISVGGVQLGHHQGETSSHPLTLDIRRGALLSEFLQFGSAGAIRLRSLRLVSLQARAIGLQLIQMELNGEENEVTLEASFDGTNLGLISERLESGLGVWRTKHSSKALAIAGVLSLHIDGEFHPANKLTNRLESSWNWKSRRGQIVRFERMVAIVRSDNQDLDPGKIAKEKLALAQHQGWSGVIAEHEAAWARRWECSDVEVGGDVSAQRALRFALYHLNGAADPNDEHISIGARALTGQDYLGHVFWDTEIFLLPFYTLTWPEAARALLIYRFHTLDGARAKAIRMGWRGALYAWESADTGTETTPEQVVGPDRKIVEVLSGKQEQHISADVAYAVWQYWQATGDESFLRDAGTEILLETARFWSSRAALEADGYFHIRGVVGPDEYHENIDDNAFTNVMARFNIGRALDAATLLRNRWPASWELLCARLGINEAELQQWLEVANTLVTGLNPESGLFEQFSGFHDLEKIDLSDYAGRSVPMDVVLGRARTQASQVIKQADVVALMALLPEEFPHNVGTANFRYYEPKCGHGSSLSRPMHGLVAARLGYSELALRYFQETSAIDLANTHVAIAGGIHIGALGGIWQMVVFGFAGISLRDDALAIDPKLPAGWSSLKFGLQWRGRSLHIQVDRVGRNLEATLVHGEAMKLFVRGERYELRRDAPLRVPVAALVEDKLAHPQDTTSIV
jgi:trehalose/maltose hydrolase-like predicted phosphorylase